MTKTHKLTRKHIASEYADSDGYWIDLKRGWKWAGDPLGCAHSIHEDTREQAQAEDVMHCECDDCKDWD